jgi:Flp pilus assembly protein TadD
MKVTPMLMRINIPLWLTIAMVLVVGCGDKTTTYRSGGYRTVEASPDRDLAAAKRYNARGLERLEKGELTEAGADFRRALVADITFGPAHNNLGKVLFAEKDWYKAAWEFEYARELMPQEPEPLNNLGLVHERVGELDRAIENYKKAVAMAPDQIELTANLARAKVRRGDTDAQLIVLLNQILDKDLRPEWREWARKQVLRLQSLRRG